MKTKMKTFIFAMLMIIGHYVLFGQIDCPYEISFKNSYGNWVAGNWKTLGGSYSNSTLNFRHVSVHAFAGDTIFARMVDTANTNNVVHPQFWVVEKEYCIPDTIFGDTLSYVLAQTSDTTIRIYAYYDSFNLLSAYALTFAKFLIPAYEITDTNSLAQGSSIELSLVNTIPIKDPHLFNLDTGYVNSIKWYRDSTLIFTGSSTDTSIIVSLNGDYFAEVGVTYIYNLVATDTTYRSVLSNSKSVILDSIPGAVQCIQSVGTTIQNASSDSTADGAVYLTINGGTPPYSFLWNNSSTQQNLVNVLPDNYSVQISSSDTACPVYYLCANVTTLDDTSTVIPDTIYTSVIDTCLGFSVVNYYVSDIITVGDTSTIIWVFVGANDVAIIASEYYQIAAGEHIAGITLFCAKGTDTFYYTVFIDTPETTAIGETSDGSEFIIFPNPASDRIYFSQNVDFTVLSVSGKEILRGWGNQLNVSGFEPGMYILKTTTTKGNSFHSFIKQ